MPETSQTTRAESEEGQRLLDAAVLQVLKHGYQDLSLRALAEQLNTSHRMLIYYFGSVDGFWEAIINRFRRMQVSMLSERALKRELPSLEAIWSDFSSSQNLPLFKLMFQIYGKALAKPDLHKDFLEHLVNKWLQTITKDLMNQHGWPEPRAKVQARVRLAAIRGLMMDLLTTGDLEGTTAAMSLFARAIEAQ